MTWARLFWLLLFVPLQATADIFTWLAGFPYERLYRENGRIREQRRQIALEKQRETPECTCVIEGEYMDCPVHEPSPEQHGTSKTAEQK